MKIRDWMTGSRCWDRKEDSGRCCGKCRCCEKTAGGKKMRCRRHKIETYFAALCSDFQPDAATEG